MSSGLVEFQRMALRKHEEAKNRKNKNFSDLFDNHEDCNRDSSDDNVVFKMDFKSKRKDEDVVRDMVDDLAFQEPKFEYADIEINNDNIYEAYDSVVNDLNIMVAKYSMMVDRESRSIEGRARDLNEYEELLEKYDDLLYKYENLLDENEYLQDEVELLLGKVKELEDELD